MWSTAESIIYIYILISLRPNRKLKEREWKFLQTPLVHGCSAPYAYISQVSILTVQDSIKLIKDLLIILKLRMTKVVKWNILYIYIYVVVFANATWFLLYKVLELWFQLLALHPPQSDSFVHVIPLSVSAD